MSDSKIKRGPGRPKKVEVSDDRAAKAPEPTPAPGERKTPTNLAYRVLRDPNGPPPVVQYVCGRCDVVVEMISVVRPGTVVCARCGVPMSKRRG